jgi:hypothetical protein
MGRRYKEGILPFKIVATEAPLIARGGLVSPYEFARSLKLPKVEDKELPRPGSGRGYKPSEFVMPLILILPGKDGGGRKLEDLREVKAEKSLRQVFEVEALTASCTVGDLLRKMGGGWERAYWSG